jgi:hypothetical protein
MKFKNKGRKIYKTKEKNYYGKTPAGKFFSGALSVLLLGGIAFLGYSVAEPIINYTRKQGDESVVSTETDSDADNSDNASDDADSTTGIEDSISIEQFIGVSLSKESLYNIDALNSALNNITDENAEYVSVPLKVEGGEIYYNTSVAEAIMCGAVRSTLTLDEITSAIKDAGYKPVAEISLLHDNIAPQYYVDMGYKTADDGSRWLDNSLDNGGKPWLSPFSEYTQEYLSSIVSEIATADFDKVVCSDVVFPPFRDSDLALLGGDVNDSNRYMSLTSLVNMVYSQMISGGTTTMLEVSAVDMLQGNCEVIQPMLLDISTIILNIDLDDMGTAVTTSETVYEFTGTNDENATKILNLVKNQLGDYNVIVRVSGSGFTANELYKVKNAIAELGYSSYIIG